MNRPFLLALLLSCGTVAASTSVLAQGDPLSAARRYVDAVNRGDVTEIVALFTDEATVAHDLYASVCRRSGSCSASV